MGAKATELLELPTRTGRGEQNWEQTRGSASIEGRGLGRGGGEVSDAI